MRIFLLIAVSIFISACGQVKIPDEIAEMKTTPPVITESTPEPTPDPDDQEAYPGISIGEKFPPAVLYSFDADKINESTSFDLAGYTVNFQKYAPLSLTQNGNVIFRFKKREEAGYWAMSAGTAHLTGLESNQIYVDVNGTAAICCNNYSIIDVGSGKPRSIYHSEDFGNFRGSMEIFDEDGDGIYEIVQMDSCLRYFNDDCGSCSPQPRAYFKYDRTKRQYLPATGVVQDFIRNGFVRSDKWLSEQQAEMKRSGDKYIQYDINRAAIAHTADLLYVGDPVRAWNVFDEYVDDPDGQIKRELNKRLSECKFYQYIKKTHPTR